MKKIKNNKNNRKVRGQIETFGLAFIVILISIGFFIFISFKSQEEVPTPQKDFTNDKLASDFILSITDVNIESCEEYTLKDLIIDCARDNERIICGSDKSCNAVNKSMYILLNKTFSEKNIAFRFYSENIKYTDNWGHTQELLNFTNLNCTNRNQGKRGTSIISLYPMQSNVYLNLNICYR